MVEQVVFVLFVIAAVSYTLYIAFKYAIIPAGMALFIWMFGPEDGPGGH